MARDGREVRHERSQVRARTLSSQRRTALRFEWDRSDWIADKVWSETGDCRVAFETSDLSCEACRSWCSLQLQWQLRSTADFCESCLVSLHFRIISQPVANLSK